MPAVSWPTIENGLRWLQQQQLLSPRQVANLQQTASAQAGAAAAVLGQSLQDRINDALSESFAAGEGYRDWQKRIKAIVAITSHEAEAIGRTYTHRAYHQGYKEIVEKPAIKDEFPYLLWLGTGDSRQRDDGTGRPSAKNHVALNDKVAHRGSPLAKVMEERIKDWGCRCSRVFISREEALERGIDDNTGWVEPSEAETVPEIELPAEQPKPFTREAFVPQAKPQKDKPPTDVASPLLSKFTPGEQVANKDLFASAKAKGLTEGQYHDMLRALQQRGAIDFVPRPVGEPHSQVESGRIVVNGEPIRDIKIKQKAAGAYTPAPAEDYRQRLEEAKPLILDAIAQHRARNPYGFAPHDLIYSQVNPKVPLTPGEFTDALRELSSSKNIRLHPYTGPSGKLGAQRSEFTLVSGREIKLYSEIGDVPYSETTVPAVEKKPKPFTPDAFVAPTGIVRFADRSQMSAAGYRQADQKVYQDIAAVTKAAERLQRKEEQVGIAPFGDRWTVVVRRQATGEFRRTREPQAESPLSPDEQLERFSQQLLEISGDPTRKAEREAILNKAVELRKQQTVTQKPFTREAFVPQERPPKEQARIEVIQQNESALQNAILATARTIEQPGGRIFISELRRLMPELTKAEFDAMLLKMERDKRIALYALQDVPSRAPPGVMEGGLRNPVGDSREMLYIPRSGRTD